jgi:hypothetical protein
MHPYDAIDLAIANPFPLPGKEGFGFLFFRSWLLGTVYEHEPCQRFKTPTPLSL